MSTVPGRGNGLFAATYVALVDLDPQLADAVLAALGEVGIAAYAAPATRRTAGELVVPRVDRLVDRVHVDRDAAARAQGVLDTELPRLRAEHEAAVGQGEDPRPPTDEDAVWAALVASFETPPAGDHPWPASEDVPAEPPPAAPRIVRTASFDELRDAILPEPAHAHEPEHEHYVPPAPPPLPRLDLVTKTAWLGLVGGPVLLLVAVVLGWDLEGWVLAPALVGFVGGFVTLVARMKDRGPDDGWDDGAVV